MNWTGSGGVSTKSGKSCERRQIMSSVLLFSRGYSRFGFGKKKLTNQNLVSPRLKSKTEHMIRRLSQPFPDWVGTTPCHNLWSISLPNLYQQFRVRISVQIRVQFRCISFTQIHALHLVEQPVWNGIFTKSYKFCQIHPISYIKNTQYFMLNNVKNVKTSLKPLFYYWKNITNNSAIQNILESQRKTIKLRGKDEFFKKWISRLYFVEFQNFDFQAEIFIFEWNSQKW